MSQPTSPNRILKVASIGLGLSMLGIILFLALYFGLSGVASAARLLIAMCVPPLIIAVLIGGYALVTGRFSPDKSDTPA